MIGKLLCRKVLLVDSCYSGGFIDHIPFYSHAVTSSDKKHPSIGSNKTSFITELLNYAAQQYQLGIKSSMKKCFDYASKQSLDVPSPRKLIVLNTVFRGKTYFSEPNPQIGSMPYNLVKKESLIK